MFMEQGRADCAGNGGGGGVGWAGGVNSNQTAAASTTSFVRSKSTT